MSPGTAKRTRARGSRAASRLSAEPQWYKDAIIYEIRVRGFHDSDGDGIGDFRGLTERLDYVEDLGITAIWLLPFCPSPLVDDGYDISDYTDVHPDCGTLDDFKVFLREAHKRGLRVITELVINHTSDQHPWFQRARRAPSGSRHRDFYVWSESPDRYSEARIIFKDFERSNWTWDPVANAYFWHRFYSYQPDLNFDSPDVRRAVIRCLDFWFKLGVDGLRLDAIPYLFEREGTNCENLPETHAFLKDLRSHVDAKFSDRMLLAEANQWPEDAVEYFGQGDECHMSFHFPVMPRLFMALQMEDRHPIIDILHQTPSIPEACQWALFLRNHDELTLEMVTDEERDYMYRMYARDSRARINLGIRRRLAPLLGNDRRRIELMKALLFSLPGTPVLYYGDEIGMGDNYYLGDRNGVRTPMQWSSDRNAGFSRANPQQLFLPVIVDPEYHYESVNVEAQQHNTYSLLHWTKRIIGLRRSTRAFGRGSIEFLHPSNRKVLAFVRAHEGEEILVVANLSRFVEYVELDLSAWLGVVPVELFSGRAFPSVGELPYLLTLGPHSFYWFRLEAPTADADGADAAAEALPRIRVEGPWASLFRDEGREALEAALPALVRHRRWFGGKGRPIRGARLLESIPLRAGDAPGVLVLASIDQEGSSEVYALTLACTEGEAAIELRHQRPDAVLAELERADGTSAVLYEALADEALCTALLDAMQRGRSFSGSRGALAASRGRRLGATLEALESLTPKLLRAEQSNTSVLYGEGLVLKIFRRPVEGVNPDLEVGRFLTDRARFAHTPATLGALEYKAGREEPRTVGILQAFVENEGDAWSFALDRVLQYFDQALAEEGGPDPTLFVRPAAALEQEPAAPPAAVTERIGDHLETARQLGQRTAEMHLALASDPEDPAFAPEPFGTLYQRSRYQAMRNITARSFDRLRSALPRLDEAATEEARALLALQDRVLEIQRSIVGERMGGMRIRCHGDYHLGQVLYTGSDFVVLDFEGEPARSSGERRLKRSPLVDIAGMLRSFDYASQYWLVGAAFGDATVRQADVARLEPWARLWAGWMGWAFLDAYLPQVLRKGLVPHDVGDLGALLRVLVLEKSLYELGYELDHRPDWVRVPLRGILAFVEESP